ncbi:membrane protein [Flavobacterium rivuli WB 3.3-2 = DSM 21788]|uniref:Membrane protein n=1 Tax=Flavobacterium rivuli WB 3.3-2 = DSM 21788 TaxID=1121895 RepID=A0A0A2M2Y4_9FLAO|nr:type IX secretion system membrane protein PorP/SprF [Flavobacterium rivuli]KGO87012.1 membrane protein [Flavobacterium rivuli WB 3.3-2 = DSM 21788]
MNFKKIYLIFGLFLAQMSFGQEGVAVYSDYLSDNYYLIHPSMAGAANCAKIRVTARQQWFGQDDAPQLQTVSFNTALGSNSGIGAIIFNDKNGYHSQTGAKLTYAHHIRFSRSDYDLNQLSFGMSAGLVQSRLDETEFEGFDPAIRGGDIVKDSYFNVDIGASYHYLDFYAHFTAKNVIKSKRELYTDVESSNLTSYLFTLGYVFGLNDDIWSLEPSVMFQAISETKEKTIDINLKAYREMDFGRLWGGLSYRRGLEGAQYQDRFGGTVKEQYLQYITPIIGVNYKSFMFSYTYSYLTGDVKFDNSGFHQITIGLNLNCKKDKYDCHCPAVN